MTTRGFFGIKNKIISSISLILILTTGFNLTYSYLMFKGDKEAYIYESALRSSELTADKFVENIKKSTEVLRTRAFLNKKQYSDPQVITTAIFDLKTNKLNPIHTSKQTNAKSLEVQLRSEKQKLQDKKFEIIKNGKNIIYILNDKERLRVLERDLSDIFDNINSDKIFNYIVTTSTGNLINGDVNLLEAFQSTINSKASKGSQLVSALSKDFLVSYSRYDGHNINVYSYIGALKAFSIFKHIIMKNILFATTLFGAFLILAVLFSNKIVGPILQIIRKTEEIAAGNLDGEVKVTTNDELKTLGTSVNSMSSKIKGLLDDKQKMIIELEEANKKLDDYNRNLEDIVAQRTKELSEANTFITAMINSLDQGLFVFDKNNNCLDIHTKACDEVFGQSPDGKSVSSVLSLSDNKVEEFAKWSELLFANKLPFSSAKALGPKNVVTGEYGDENFKHVDLNYFPMTDENEELKNVVVVGTDNTHQVKATEAFKEKDSYVNMILNIIKNKSSFYDFIDEVLNMLQDLEDNFEAEGLEDNAMIVFHTFNGGFGTFSVQKLHKLARENEEKIKTFEGSEDQLKELIKALQADYKQNVLDFIEDINNSLKSEVEYVEIEKSELEEFKDEIFKLGEEAKTLFVNTFEKTKIAKLFEGYIPLVQRISEKVNKPMNPLKITGGDIRVELETYKDFGASLVHLFRNCMDHGIEDQATRKDLGKDENGTISIDIKKDSNNLIFTISDDGAGINVGKIREILTQSGSSDGTNLSDEEIMMCIFRPNLSTNTEVTELSGRGIGMSAIKKAIEKLNGQLSVKSEKSKGSTFNFTLPLK